MTLFGSCLHSARALPYVFAAQLGLLGVLFVIYYQSSLEQCKDILNNHKSNSGDKDRRTAVQFISVLQSNRDIMLIRNLVGSFHKNYYIDSYINNNGSSVSNVSDLTAASRMTVYIAEGVDVGRASEISNWEGVQIRYLAKLPCSAGTTVPSSIPPKLSQLDCMLQDTLRSAEVAIYLNPRIQFFLPSDPKQEQSPLSLQQLESWRNFIDNSTVLPIVQYLKQQEQARVLVKYVESGNTKIAANQEASQLLFNAIRSNNNNVLDNVLTFATTATPFSMSLRDWVTKDDVTNVTMPNLEIVHYEAWCFVRQSYSWKYPSTPLVPSHTTTKIGILLPSTSRFSNGSYATEPEQLLIITKFITSFLEKSDLFYDNEENLQKFQETVRAMNTRQLRLAVKLSKYPPAYTNNVYFWNALAYEAYMDGCHYMYQVGDDMQLDTQGWEGPLIAKLKEKNNVGAVAPSNTPESASFQANNLLVDSFVHRTHYDIFHYHFPHIFKNWWADEWTTRVYEVGQYAFFVPDVTLTHTSGKRYIHCGSDRAFLEKEIDSGKQKLRQFLTDRKPKAPPK